MAFGVTDEGFVIKPLETITQEVEDVQHQTIDPGLDVSSRSLLGQMNDSLLAKVAELWELMQGVYNSQYPETASGDSLTSVASITGTDRGGAGKTIVNGAVVTLSPNSPLPINSVASISGQPSARFLTVTALPGSVTGGLFTVDFIAESTGAIEVPAGALVDIAEPVPGWTEVTNPAEGVEGTAVEEDDELRIKRDGELTAQGSTSVDAIRADLLRLAGVVDANVFENVEAITVDGLRPHSIRAIVRGGISQEIADQIQLSKSSGINTNGLIELTVTDTQGFDHTIRHDTASAIDFFATLALVVDDLLFDFTQGPIDVQTKVQAYVDGLGIGKEVVYDQVKCVALEVVGVKKFVSVFIDFSASPTGTIDLPVDQDNYAEVDDLADIIVTVP